MTLERQEYVRRKAVIIRRIINEFLAIGEISISGQLDATLTKRQTRMMEWAKVVGLVGISGLQWNARNPIFGR